jgi:hypothetical protein
MSNHRPEELAFHVSVKQQAPAALEVRGLTNIQGTIVNLTGHELSYEKASVDGSWVIAPPPVIRPGEACAFELTNTGSTSLWVYYLCAGTEIGFKAWVPAVGVNEFGVWTSRDGLLSKVDGQLRGWNVTPIYTVADH